MTPSDALVAQMASALATTPPLDQVTALNRVALVMEPFTPTRQTLLADLVLATFDGSTEKTVALGAQGSAQDPVTLQQIITIVEPLGGWRWVTSGTTNLPQSIYGFVLFDSSGPGPLLGSELLPEAITLTAIGQEVNLGTVKFTMVVNPLS